MICNKKSFCRLAMSLIDFALFDNANVDKMIYYLVNKALFWNWKYRRI